MGLLFKTRRNISEPYWHQAFLRMKMDIIPFLKWGSWAANLMVFHAKATEKDWVGFGFLPPPTSGCCGSLKIERGRRNLMTLWCVTGLVRWYMSALKGKILSVIFTMVHLYYDRSQRLKPKNIVSCSMMAISPSENQVPSTVNEHVVILGKMWWGGCSFALFF